MTTSNPTQEDGARSTIVGIKNGEYGELMEFDREAYKELSAEYLRARLSEADSFTFRGYELLTGYTRYLLEYLDGRLE